MNSIPPASNGGGRVSVAVSSCSHGGHSSNPRPQQQYQQAFPRHFALTCNGCRKGLSGEVVICSCSCIFCTDCATRYIRNRCPRCHRPFNSETDFTKVVVADASCRAIIRKPESLYDYILESDTGTANYNNLYQNILKQLVASTSSVNLYISQLLRCIDLKDRENFKLKGERAKDAQKFASLNMENDRLKRELEEKNARGMAAEEELKALRSQLQTLIQNRDSFRKRTSGSISRERGIEESAFCVFERKQIEREYDREKHYIDRSRVRQSMSPSISFSNPKASKCTRSGSNSCDRHQQSDLHNCPSRY